MSNLQSSNSLTRQRRIRRRILCCDDGVGQSIQHGVKKRAIRLHGVTTKTWILLLRKERMLLTRARELVDRNLAPADIIVEYTLLHQMEEKARYMKYHKNTFPISKILPAPRPPPPSPSKIKKPVLSMTLTAKLRISKAFEKRKLLEKDILQRHPSYYDLPGSVPSTNSSSLEKKVQKLTKTRSASVEAPSRIKMDNNVKQYKGSSFLPHLEPITISKQSQKKDVQETTTTLLKSVQKILMNFEKEMTPETLIELPNLENAKVGLSVNTNASDVRKIETATLANIDDIKSSGNAMFMTRADYITRNKINTRMRSAKRFRIKALVGRAMVDCSSFPTLPRPRAVT